MRNLHTIAVGMLLSLALTGVVFIGCLDEPPALPPRDNPWDPNNPAPPRAPDSLRGWALSETEVLLVWRDRSGNEDGFRVSEMVNDTSQATPIAETGPDTCTLTVPGRSPLTDYAYFIEAFNEAGSSYPAGPLTVSTRRSPPRGPTGLRAQTASETEILLTWEDHSDIEAVSYTHLTLPTN